LGDAVKTMPGAIILWVQVIPVQELKLDGDGGLEGFNFISGN